MSLPASEIEGHFRREYGRTVVTRVQDAFLVAIDRWPVTGLPPNPGAWITTTSRNRPAGSGPCGRGRLRGRGYPSYGVGLQGLAGGAREVRGDEDGSRRVADGQQNK